METELESWLLSSISVPLCTDTKERSEVLQFVQFIFQMYTQLKSLTIRVIIQKTALGQSKDLPPG